MKNRNEELERLRKMLEENRRPQAPVVNFDDSEEWRKRFEELQNRHRKDIDNYENELQRKDQIIMELREKINQLLSQPQMTGMTYHHEPQSDDKDELISKLRTTVGDRDNEINQLTSKLRSLMSRPDERRFQVVEAPEREVKYEKDPYLIEQNAKLARELEKALVPFLT